MNIVHHLERSARLFGDSPALIFEGGTISYRRLDALAQRSAQQLQGHGVERGDRVALLLHNVPSFVIAYYGILKLGAVAVSINTRLTTSEVATILADCGPKLLLASADLLEGLDARQLPSLTQLVLPEIWMGGADGQGSAGILDGVPCSDMAWSPEVERHDPAAILYTSGTTGRPKGATLSHGNVVSNTWSFVHLCGISSCDRVLVVLPLFHCFAQNALMNSAVLAGAALVLQRTFRVEAVLEAIRLELITKLFAVPTMFQALLEPATPEGLVSLRYCFSAAASLPLALEQRWLERFGMVIHQGYGLTETSPFASYNHCFDVRQGSIGMPIENVEMKVVDLKTGSDLPPGQAGEILIKGPNVMLGYWNDPEATAAVLRDGWFHSGDIGSVDADGYFTLLDRLKDVIDVGGMNVYPVEVENVLYQHPAVAEAAVFGCSEALMGEQVRAAVVLRPGVQVEPGALRDHCSTVLADFKVPVTFELVDALPKNPAGKILKRLLRDQASASHAKPEPLVLPQTGRSPSGVSDDGALVLETLLREELAAVLDLSPGDIERDEPLVDLGLTSLQAVELNARLFDRLGLRGSSLTLLNGTLRSVSCALASDLAAAQASRQRG